MPARSASVPLQIRTCEQPGLRQRRVTRPSPRLIHRMPHPVPRCVHARVHTTPLHALLGPRSLPLLRHLPYSDQHGRADSSLRHDPPGIAPRRLASTPHFKVQLLFEAFPLLVSDGSFSCVVKTQKCWSNKIYKTKLTKIRYKNQVMCKYRVDPQRAGLTLITELTWSNLGLKGVLNK